MTITRVEEVLVDLEKAIEERKDANPDESYVASLLQGDPDRLLKKIGEEATEVILASKSGRPGAVSSESADLVFHLMVLLAQHGLGFRDVLACIDSRSGVSGFQEKSLRSTRKSS